MIPFAKDQHSAHRDPRLDDLFASGEEGDWWWFHTKFMNLKGFNEQISSVTGQVNELELTPLDDVSNKRANTRLADENSTLSGYQCAYFDGTSLSDTLHYDFGSTIAQPGTIILALKSSDTDTGIYCTGSSDSLRWQISNDGGDDIVAFAGSELDSTFNSPIGTKVLAVEYNGASSRFIRNGTVTATGNAGSQGTDQLTLGAVWDETFPAEFFLFAALFIDRILTSDELDRAQRILGSKGGITW
jgi:hypothetical protein